VHEKIKGKLHRIPAYSSFWPEVHSSFSETSHVAVIFRELGPARGTKAKYFPVQVHWNRDCAEVDMSSISPLPPYQGLIPEEPVGIVWKDRAKMAHMGAHGVPISGIYSTGLVVYSVIDNGDQQNEHRQDGTTLYCGHGSNDMRLQGLNKSLANTGCTQQPIRFYVGSKSSHPGSPKVGYCLLGIRYIVSFAITPYNRVRQSYGALGPLADRFCTNDKPSSFQYQWTFELSPHQPSISQQETMQTLFLESTQ
jgi:SAD/SRA domain